MLGPHLHVHVRAHTHARAHTHTHTACPCPSEGYDRVRRSYAADLVAMCPAGPRTQTRCAQLLPLYSIRLGGPWQTDMSLFHMHRCTRSAKVQAAMTGKADRLKDFLLGLSDANLFDESRIDVDLSPLLRVFAPAFLPSRRGRPLSLHFHFVPFEIVQVLTACEERLCQKTVRASELPLLDVRFNQICQPERNGRGKLSPDRKGRSSPDRTSARLPAQKALPGAET